jgi:hypothetical protein
LNHQTPIQALKKWHNEKPELFVKRVYKQAGLDTYPRRCNANVIRIRIEQSIKAMDDVDRQVFGYRRISERPGGRLQFTRRV